MDHVESKRGCVGRNFKTCDRRGSDAGGWRSSEESHERLVNKCVTDGSDGNESSSLFFKVKGDLVNGSSLLSEEGALGHSYCIH